MKTQAVPDGDDFIINGSKQWISNSEEAKLFIVMANAKPTDVSLIVINQPFVNYFFVGEQAIQISADPYTQPYSYVNINK